MQFTENSNILSELTLCRRNFKLSKFTVDELADIVQDLNLNIQKLDLIEKIREKEVSKIAE